MPSPEPTTLDPASRQWTLATAGVCLLALLVHLPPTLATGLGATGVALAFASWKRPLPAPLRALLAITMVVAVMAFTGMQFGRDTGCALLAAMLAIKPTETRSLRDNRSLLGFALFAPFAAFLLDQGPLSMALGLVGVLSSLVALHRLADAEVTLSAVPARPLQQLRQVGKLVLIGVPLVMAAFWLFPRFPTPLWGVPERALSKPGLSDEMSPGGWLDLIADDTPALRVQFFGATPPTSQMYWRGPVLADFDGRTWTRGNPLSDMPPAESMRAPTVWDYQMDVEPTDNRDLVMLDLPVAAPEGTRLTRDYSTRTRLPLNALSRWRVQSSAPTRFDVQLPDAVRRQALQLPAGFNPRTRALGAQWRREAGGNDAVQVARALDWIRSSFAYTLNTPFPGRNTVDEFLFDQQAGYCEHFSSAFVFLMRSGGVPARVVTGYTGGTYNRLGDYWIVRNMDAHAWAEVWLPQRGWVRVDPTAAVAPERIYDTLEDRLGGARAGGAGLISIDGLGQMSDWLRRGWNDMVLGFDAKRQTRILQQLGAQQLGPSGLAALFGVFAMIAVGWMAWLLARGERERDPLLRAWHRLGARYARLGLGREPHETAGAWAYRVVAQRPEGANPLVSLSRRFAAARYAADEGDNRALIEDLRRHRP
jgi:transglutaminase-like putative cysteine protease